MKMLIGSIVDKSRCSWTEAEKDRALTQSSALAESVKDALILEMQGSFRSSYVIAVGMFRVRLT